MMSRPITVETSPRRSARRRPGSCRCWVTHDRAGYGEVGSPTENDIEFANDPWDAWLRLRSVAEPEPTQWGLPGGRCRKYGHLSQLRAGVHP